MIVGAAAVIALAAAFFYLLYFAYRNVIVVQPEDSRKPSEVKSSPPMPDGLQSGPPPSSEAYDRRPVPSNPDALFLSDKPMPPAPDPIHWRKESEFSWLDVFEILLSSREEDQCTKDGATFPKESTPSDKMYEPKIQIVTEPLSSYLEGKALKRAGSKYAKRREINESAENIEYSQRGNAHG